MTRKDHEKLLQTLVIRSTNRNIIRLPSSRAMRGGGESIQRPIACRTTWNSESQDGFHGVPLLSLVRFPTLPLPHAPTSSIWKTLVHRRRSKPFNKAHFKDVKPNIQDENQQKKAGFESFDDEIKFPKQFQRHCNILISSFCRGKCELTFTYHVLRTYRLNRRINPTCQAKAQALLCTQTLLVLNDEIQLARSDKCINPHGSHWPVELCSSKSY